MLEIINTIRNFGRNKPLLFSVQIEQINEFNSGKYISRFPGFIIHFHRRKNWTPWGFQKTINTTYYLSEKHAFRIFQLLNEKAKFTAFHMHSKDNWIISFVINWYVKNHI